MRRSSARHASLTGRRIAGTLVLVAAALAACSNDEPAAGAATAASANPHAGHEMKPGGEAAQDPKAHRDHDGRHGGVLTMEGDYHVEILVSADGSVALYVSDAIRGALPASEVKGNLVIEGPGGKDRAVFPLAPGDNKAVLAAKGPPPDGSTTYTWELDVNGTKLKMSLPVPKGGTTTIASPPATVMEH